DGADADWPQAAKTTAPAPTGTVPRRRRRVNFISNLLLFAQRAGAGERLSCTPDCTLVQHCTNSLAATCIASVQERQPRDPQRGWPLAGGGAQGECARVLTSATGVRGVILKGA